MPRVKDSEIKKLSLPKKVFVSDLKKVCIKKLKPSPK